MRKVFLVALLGWSCSFNNHDSIVLPPVNNDFFERSFLEIDNQLTEDPGNEKLLSQKLHFCEKLDWPVSCIDALDAVKRKEGINNQLVTSYINYYIKHQQFDLLLTVIDSWIEEYDLQEEYILLYIKSLVQAGKDRQATLELSQYLVLSEREEDLLFAGEQYLKLGNHALAALCLGKVYQRHYEHPAIWDYGILLFELGHREKALTVLDSCLNKQATDDDKSLKYALLLDKSGQTKRGRDVIKSIPEKSDTANYLLAEWFLKDGLWDSAGHALNQVIARDSSLRKPIWKAGRLYEDRGWFSTASRYYELLLEKDSLDTLASQRIDLIQRKIAYLQRQKFEESKTPVFEIQPKKIENR